MTAGSSNRPRRLVSLAPNVSMILFALGADHVVVGRTQYCVASIRDYLDTWGVSGEETIARLAHWEALPDMGAWPRADHERAASLRPDMVLASGSGPFDTHEASMFGLRPEALINFDTRTLADLDRQILTIGEIVCRPEAARELVSQLAARRDGVLAQRRMPAGSPAILFEYCICIKYHPDPARRRANPGRFIMVGGYLAAELIRLCGGKPLLAQRGDAVAWVDFNSVRDARPDMILAFDCQDCPNAMSHPVARRPGWPELKAVSGHAVYRPRRNIANPNLCYPSALAELMELVTIWDDAQPKNLINPINGSI
ncbi:ABC transporter substrate-binding protein [Taklimakanibacter deserti]|uniref:ABC transporter substrate-binding protein n=1 Tax=Taklimakanibacter deserti TaxID=2267839 RepID=UPI000E65BEE9